MKLTTERGETIFVRFDYGNYYFDIAHNYEKVFTGIDSDICECFLYKSLDEKFSAFGKAKRNTKAKDSPNRVLARQISFRRALNEYTNDYELKLRFWEAYCKKYRVVYFEGE